MKKLKLSMLLILLCSVLFSQVPYSFNYQAVLRDGDGRPLVDQPVTVEISIFSRGPIEVFDELQHVTTNAQGIINLEIGSVSDLSLVDWAAEEYFISISVDGKLISTTQLLSVPYALHANIADRTLGDSLWKQSADAIYYQGGKLGIGTSVPEGTMHISDTATLSSTSSLYLETKNIKSRLLNSSTSPGLWIQSGTEWESGSVSDINFSGMYGTPSHMVIKSNGNIGIGVSDPGTFGLNVNENKDVRMGHYINIADYDHEDPDAQIISRDGNLMVWTGGLFVGRAANGDNPPLGYGNLVVEKDIVAGENLTVEGTTQLGISGIKISEIREFTGTTPIDETNKYILLPPGWTIDNTRLVSTEFQSFDSWGGPILINNETYYIIQKARLVRVTNSNYILITAYQLDRTTGITTFYDTNYRIIAMRVE